MQKTSDKSLIHINLQIILTAPPFHPNCGCTVVPYVESEEEPENEESETNGDQIVEYVNSSQLEYIGFTNVTDSMVKELNETLAKYNITSKEQIAHFFFTMLCGLLAWKWSNRNKLERLS